MMDDAEIRMIRRLQFGLPLTPEPFADLADELSVSEETLLGFIRAWQANGVIRRFGAVLGHSAAGFRANAMGVWNVPDDRVDEFGRLASSRDSISHCYRRPVFEGFPFNVYTMIHGRSREECEEVARTLSQETGISHYELLFTTAEYKKTAPMYFLDETG